ncbi:hypothetical protein [Burkholderia sp. AW49-1]
MMEAILSNDEEDWHSHLERSVKESQLDWHGGLFVIGGTHAGARSGPDRARRIPLRALPGERLREIDTARNDPPRRHSGGVGSH